MAPVPSRRDGTSRQRIRRAAKPSSSTSSRARSTLPPRGESQVPGHIRVHPLADEPGREGPGGDGVEVDADAAAGDGGHLGGDDVGQENEDGVARRLLQGLEQHRGGQPGQVEVGDGHHLAPGFEGPALGQADHPAGVGHGHRGPGPVHLDQVGMEPGQAPPARRALPAPARRAQQGGGESPDQGPLTDAGRSHQQVGVDGPPRRGAQLVHGRVLAHDLVEQGADGRSGVGVGRLPRPGAARRRTRAGGHGTSVGAGPRRESTAALTRAATSSTSPVPSTTTHRRGSAAARAR